MVSSPRISIGPAGCRINRDYARRGWATETGHPSWGPRDPGYAHSVVATQQRPRDSLVPPFRKLLKTGPSEVTLSWTPPAMPETVKSYQISVTCLLPSEDSAFMFEVLCIAAPRSSKESAICFSFSVSTDESFVQCCATWLMHHHVLPCLLHRALSALFSNGGGCRSLKRVNRRRQQLCAGGGEQVRLVPYA